MSGGEGKLVAGIIFGGLGGLGVATIAGAWSILHAVRLLNTGPSTAGYAFLGCGILLVIPLVIAALLVAWKLARPSG